VGWLQNDAVLHAGALAYFTIFSLAPLSIISVAIAGMMFSQAAVAGLVVDMLQDFVGAESAALIQDIILNSDLTTSSGLAALIGLGVMLYGAAIVFFRLQTGMHAMWGLVPKTDDVRKGVISIIKTALLSIVAVLTVGVYLLVLLIISTLWTTIPKLLPQGYLEQFVSNSHIIVPLLSFVIAPILYVLPFALIYVGLSKAVIRWRDVWPGAALSAVLFWIGSNIIGLYLTYSGITSIYGAAGSLVAFLIWIFYSAMVFLFGAKFTQIYAEMYGTPIEPVEGFAFKSDKTSR
jgi:membrane protein